MRSPIRSPRVSSRVARVQRLARVAEGRAEARREPCARDHVIPAEAIVAELTKSYRIAPARLA